MFEIKQYSRIDGKLKDSYMIHNVSSLLEMHSILIGQNGSPDRLLHNGNGFTLEYYNKIIIVNN